MSQGSDKINRERDANQQWTVEVVKAALRVADDDGLPHRPSVLALRQILAQNGD